MLLEPICIFSNQVSSEIEAASGIFRHPLLGVVMCKQCSNYYDDGDWVKDEEGFDTFCRWCGQGGDIILCDKCTHAFCKKCLQVNSLFLELSFR